MNKTVVKVLGLGALAIGGVVFAMFVKDEKDALSKDGVKEWAENKVKESRTDEVNEYFEKYKEAEKLYNEDKDRIEKSINDQLKKWKHETKIDEKLNRLERNRERDLDDYRKSISYDEKIKQAYRTKDDILKQWEEEYDYAARKREIDESLKEAKGDYERGKKALELISNDGVKEVSKKVLKEEYKKRCESLNESKESLKTAHEAAERKAEKYADDIINPIKEDYRAKKVEIDGLYSGSIQDLHDTINNKRESIKVFEYANRSEPSIRIEKHYKANKDRIDKVKETEENLVNEYVQNSDKYICDIMYYNLKKKGWSKPTLYFFEGVLPISIGCGFLYAGYRCIKWGVFNIRAIHAVTSKS